MSHLHVWCMTHLDFNVAHDSFTYDVHDSFFVFHERQVGFIQVGLIQIQSMTRS